MQYVWVWQPTLSRHIHTILCDNDVRLPITPIHILEELPAITLSHLPVQISLLKVYDMHLVLQYYWQAQTVAADV